MSGVFWGEGPPELVFLHGAGESARAWDAVALAVGRASVAIDLPGHGRSDWRRDGRYEPAKLAPAVAEAIRSFAPRARIVVGTGLGGRTAVALHRRHPQLLARLALVDTLPGAGPGRAQDGTDPKTPKTPGSPERFASREEAYAVLASRRPERGSPALRREILYELAQDPDGSWGWRHHPDNLPGDPAAAPDDDALWHELGLYAHENVWPADDRALRGLTHHYIAAARDVAERVLGLYAVAQDLPAGTFPVSPLPYLTFTVNNYPTWTYADSDRDEDKLPQFTESGEETDFEPVTTWDLIKGGVEDYLKVFGRPQQVTAWREGRPYVADLAENSAGR